MSGATAAIDRTQHRRSCSIRRPMQRELVRHYTLLRRRPCPDPPLPRRPQPPRLRADALLPALSWPAVAAGERPPAAWWVLADQIGVPPCLLDDYLAEDRTRQRHATEWQDRLQLRPFGPSGRTVTAALLPHAMDNDRLVTLVAAAVEIMRTPGLLLPPPATLERLCPDVRHQARREIHRRLADGLSGEQRQGLDALTHLRPNGKQSWLAWLRQMPEAAKPTAMLGLIERLEHVRAIGIDRRPGHRVHQARLAQLAREAGRTTVQHSPA